jgi:hypothetical protein
MALISGESERIRSYTSIASISSRPKGFPSGPTCISGFLPAVSTWGSSTTSFPSFASDSTFQICQTQLFRIAQLLAKREVISWRTRSRPSLPRNPCCHFPFLSRIPRPELPRCRKGRGNASRRFVPFRRHRRGWLGTIRSAGVTTHRLR